MSEQKTTEEILASMGVTPTAPTPTTFAGFVEVFDTFRKLVIAHERACASPDPRDEALRLARESLENCEGMVDELRDYPVTYDLLIEALAAIDKVMKG